ncbi:MAG: hypothetical protein ACRD2X_18080 [Vicinamibacteraceae bacterium]
MRHLSRTELVDLAEGVLAAERAAHVDECARCREQGDVLRRVATDVRTVEMPEPSPLFWDHLSAQIRGAVDGEPQRSHVYDIASWWTSGVRRLSPDLKLGPTRALAIALVAVVVAGLWWLAASRFAGPGGTAPQVAQRELPPSATQIEPVSPDAGWELVSSMADREGMLDEEGLAVEIAPGAAERALLSLTADEQRELVRLLDEAMARGPDARLANPES